MSFEYCKDEKHIFEDESISSTAWGWGGELAITLGDALRVTVKKALFIDRGYLRFVDTEDSDCMDHGDKLKINFCPACGERLVD